MGALSVILEKLMGKISKFADNNSPNMEILLNMRFTLLHLFLR